jgi:hypothetical protein
LVTSRWEPPPQVNVILESGTPKEIFESTQRPETRRFLDAVL